MKLRPGLKTHANICGTRYAIHIVRELTETSPEGHALQGTCDYSRKRITVEFSDKPGTQRTVLHEIIHAILHETGLAALLPGFAEEALVLTLDNFLYLAGFRWRPND